MKRLALSIGIMASLLILALPVSGFDIGGDIDPIKPPISTYSVDVDWSNWMEYEGLPTERNGYNVHFPAYLAGADTGACMIKWEFEVTAVDDNTVLATHVMFYNYTSANGAYGWWNWDMSSDEVDIPDGDYTLWAKATGWIADDGTTGGMSGSDDTSVVIDSEFIVKPVPTLPDINTFWTSEDFHLGSPKIVFVFDQPFYAPGELITFHLENHGDAWGFIGASSPRFVIHSEEVGWVKWQAIHTCDVRIIMPGERDPWNPDYSYTWDQTFMLSPDTYYEPNDPHWDNYELNGQQVPTGVYDIYMGEAVGHVAIVESPEDYAEYIENLIENLPDGAFTKKNGQNTILNKMNALENMIAAGNYEGAINKIYNDLIPSIEEGISDDYAEEKAQIIQALEDLAAYLQSLIDG